jgi:hypothetical protein
MNLQMATVFGSGGGHKAVGHVGEGDGELQARGGAEVRESRRWIGGRTRWLCTSKQRGKGEDGGGRPDALRKRRKGRGVWCYTQVDRKGSSAPTMARMRRRPWPVRHPSRQAGEELGPWIAAVCAL